MAQTTSTDTPTATETGADAAPVADPGAVTPWWRSTRAVAALAAVAILVAAVLGALWATDDSADRLAALESQLATDAAAEEVAGDYAMAVSEVDYEDLDAWRSALATGVSDQLAPKLEAAVDVVGPWLTRMEYTSTARLLAATLSESDGDTYVVQVFVDMTSRSKQTPEGVAATATYTVTMDRASDWTITDVGGVGAGLPGAGESAAGAPDSRTGGR